MTDQDLIQGIVERNQTVFKELVTQHQQLVIRTCYSLVHNLEDAEDLAQDVFIEIMRSTGSFRGKAKLSSWIYRIAVNKALNHLKKKRTKEFIRLITFKTKTEREELEQDHGKDQSGADTRMEAKELQTALHSAIDRLPENQRIAFALHHYEDLPYRDIAEVMGVSLASVESLIHRGKMNLQKRLNHYYQDYR